MLEFENAVRIDRPIEDVFAFLADFENIPKWNYYVVDVKKISHGPVSVGSRYHQVRKTDEQTFRLISFEPGRLIEAKTEPGSLPQLEMRFVVQPEEGKTLLRDQWKLATGKPAILEKLAARSIKSAVAENLGKLKQLLENGWVILQDGRRMTL
jgi:uncharacterized membrane protein